MKHVFVVHSYVTLIVAQLVAIHLELDRSNIRFICTRGMQPLLEDLKISLILPFNWKPEPFPIRCSLFNAWKQMYSLDTVVCQLVENDRFKLYIPHYAIRYCQMLMTHWKCMEVSLIEEGMGCYLEREKLRKRYRRKFTRQEKVRNIIKYAGRLKEYAFVENPQDIYVITDYAFPDFITTNVFRQKQVCSLLNIFEFNIVDKATILVMDAAVTANYLNIETYIDAIKKSLHKIGNNKIYIKFHPSQTWNERRRIWMEIIDLYPYLTLIPDTVPLEKFIFNDREYFFLGNVSSILFYAGLMGKPALSFCRRIPNNKSVVSLAPIFDYYVSEL